MVKKSRFRWWGFNPQFFLFLVLPLTIVILVVAFGSQALHHDAMRALVGDRDLKTARAAANSLEAEITHRSSIIKLLANEIGTQPNLEALAAEQGGNLGQF